MARGGDDRAGLRLTGEVRVPTPAAGRKFVRPVVNRIAWELESENVGRVEESRDRVTYRRESGLSPGRSRLFASFDPGEFVVDAEGTIVTIRYALGLRPALFALSLLVCCFLSVILFSSQARFITPLFGGAVALLGTAFLFNLWRVRVWLKAAASTAIARSMAPLG